MMTGAISDDQARGLAAFVAGIHPGWDVPGIRAAISKARHRAPAHEVGIALIRYAMRSDLRTPGMFHEDGAHWHATGQAGAASATFERCTVDGHQSYPAWNCGACRVDALEPTEPVSLVLPAEQLEVNARGLELVRATAHTTPVRPLDGRSLAAGERDEP